MVIVKTTKYAHLADAIAVCTTLTHCIYCIVNSQGRQIKNLFVQLVLCMLNELLAHNLSPNSVPLDCSIQAAGHYEAGVRE